MPDWRPNSTQVLWAIRITIILGVLIAIGYSYGITLWEWAELLIVPAVIAAGGVWFNQQQRTREMEIAEQRAQDEALQAYLDQMGELLLDEDRPLRRSAEGDEVRTLARARTLTVLGRFDPSRRTQVMQFLIEAGLVQGQDEEDPIVSLKETKVTGVDLTGTNLYGAILAQADLSGANLYGASLAKADLERADLGCAVLAMADLYGADLTFANLECIEQRGNTLSRRGTTLAGANLENARLVGAKLRGVYLRGATGITNEELAQQANFLEGATMPDGQKYEDWLESKGTGEGG